MRGRNQRMWQSSFLRASRSWRFREQSILRNVSADCRGAATTATSPRVCTLAIALCKAAATLPAPPTDEPAVLSWYEAGSFVCMCLSGCDCPPTSVRRTEASNAVRVARLGGKQVEWEARGCVASEAVAALNCVSSPASISPRTEPARHGVAREYGFESVPADADTDAYGIDGMRCDESRTPRIHPRRTRCVPLCPVPISFSLYKLFL